MKDLNSGWVSTSKGAPLDRRAEARRIAEACGLAYSERKPAGVTRCVVLESEAARLEVDGHIATSNAGMGFLRLRRLLRGGDRDVLAEVCGVRPGDHVFDGTFGFGQDALVLSHLVGDTGRMTAAESSPLLCALAMAGRRFWPAPAGALVAGIDLRFGDAREVLRVSEKAFDVVYLDPMFRRPKAASDDFSILRAVADPAPIDADLVLLARKAARRRVVVKDMWPGRDLVRLGLTVVELDRREFTFGVAEPL